MVLFTSPPRQRIALTALGLAALLALAATVAPGQQGKPDVLRIGTTSSLAADKEPGKEKGALQTLKAFIKDETGFKNDILRQKNWQELADKMAKGQIELGVFQGYEFAWAKAKHSALQPLAVAVNVYRYPIVYVVVRRNNPAKDFAGLKGQALAIPAESPPYLRLFVEHESQLHGKKLNTFFAKVLTRENVEDALDDVVDGKLQTVVADRSSLEAYKRRKPGRFKQLREVARSQPLPPAVVAYYDSKLSEATLRRLRDGLLRAARTERGETMLTLFRITGFELPPPDFGKVLARTRQEYPPTTVSTE